MKIVNVVGARPNFIKIAPILAQMSKHAEINPVLVHTGQHYDTRMSKSFFEDLDIPKPDHDLGIGSGTHAQQTAKIMLALEPLLQEERPDLVLVVGDVNSTVAATLVAAKLNIPVAHLEAGLRSFDRSMPEEINRKATDAISDLLFTTERAANENLCNEGVADERVFFVGNVMIDTLSRHRARAERLDITSRFGVDSKNYALVTLHRPANVDDPEILHNLLKILDYLQQRLPTLFPVHPRTLQKLQASGFEQQIKAMSNLRFLEPQGYVDFLGLMAQAQLVLTDSGGVQEETTVLGVPCLTLRDNTERPVTVEVGANRLVGRDYATVVAAIQQVIDGDWPAGECPELWDGHAAERIVGVLLEKLAS